jgi:hypothetical protein
MNKPLPPVSPDDRSIWWLASYPKSGSTWVRMFMNCFISGFPLNINTAFQYVISDTHLPLVQSATLRPATELTDREQVYARTAMLMNALNMSQAIDLCVKTHHAKVNVDDIPLIPPKITKRALYLIRDPRDVVISMADHMGESIDTVIEYMNNMTQAARHRTSNQAHYLLTWSKHVESWTGRNNNVEYTVIRYEDLVANPEEVFIKVVNALGFHAINKDKFNFALKQTTFENLRAMEDEFGFKEKGEGEKFFRVGKAGQWKTVLTEEQIRLIEENHKEVMSQHGYEPALVRV